MTLVERLKTLPRRLPAPPMWLLMVLSGLAVAMALAVFLADAERARRVVASKRAGRQQMLRQQLQATQALEEEVRKLRETLEERR
jgi:Mg2+/citrate symporter